MAKIFDQVVQICNENIKRDKEVIIAELVRKLKLSKGNAQAYYYKWKKEFMTPAAHASGVKNEEAESKIAPCEEPTPKIDKVEAKELVAEFKNPDEEPNETAFENSPEQFEQFEKVLKAIEEEPSMSTLGILPEQIKEALKEIGEEPAQVEDNIYLPSHYTSGKFETIEIIEDLLTAEELRGYLIGNVIKYISRHKGKGGIEDLKKARNYLNRRITGKWFIEKEEN